MPHPAAAGRGKGNKESVFRPPEMPKCLTGGTPPTTSKGVAMPMRVSAFGGVVVLAAASIFAAASATQSFYGVGVGLGQDASTVERVIPGGGAEKAGLTAGCRIVSVDGKPTKGMTVQQVTDLIRGPEGSTVKLEVVQDLGLTKVFTIQRTQLRTVGEETLAGTYAFQDDPSILVIIERADNHRFNIRCEKQHWSGMGLVGNNCFKGVFQMEDHPEVLADFRGAVSFFRVDFQFADMLTLRSRFNFADKSDKIVEKTLVRKKG
jgi:hypothetical protein